MRRENPEVWGFSIALVIARRPTSEADVAISTNRGLVSPDEAFSTVEVSYC